jgi:hypothetical protein
MPPPPGKHWQWTPEKLDKFDAQGDIYWTRNGTPRRKIWADESEGSSATNIWLNFRDPFNQNFKTTGYPTEKNLGLLERLVRAATNPGDIVLDSYCGSGTTLEAASSLGRKWIGIDRSALAVAVTQRRLAESFARGNAAASFELWRNDMPTTRGDADLLTRLAAADEVDFGLVERPLRGGANEVLKVCGHQALLASILSLRRGERLVVFNHSGAEVCFEESALEPIKREPLCFSDHFQSHDQDAVIGLF